MKGLEKFGAFMIARLRDSALEHYEQLENGMLRTPAVQPLQDSMQALKAADKEVVHRCVVRIIDSALHDLLAGLQESHDLEQGIEVFVDGENVAELSGMLHGEVFGEEGWISRFSKHPLAKDIP